MSVTKSLSAIAFMSGYALAHAAPAHSYLAEPAASLDQLVSQVQQDKASLSGYAHHFHLTERAVANYLRTLHLETMTQKGLYSAYTNDALGSKPELVTIEVGDAVFANASGQAILRASDGAPLVPETDSKSDSVVTGSADMAGGSITASAVGSVGAQSQTDGSSPETFGSPWYTGVMSGIGFAGGLAMFTGQSGTGPGSGASPNAAPEPVSFLVVGVGIAGLMVRRKRR